MAVRKMDHNQRYESLVPERLLKNIDWNKILICDGLIPTEVLNLSLQTEFKHICQTSHPHFESELKTAAYLSDKNTEFDKYPLSSIIDPERVSTETEKLFTSYSFNFNRAVQKSQILAGVSAKLIQLKVSSSVLSDGVIIADELVTNAVFNAPFVDLSNSKSGVSRDNKDVKMHDGKSARIFMGSDESRIIIGCSDPYGSLNLIKFFERIKRCYDVGVAKNINMTGGGGAGIGSFMVFNASESFYAVVEKGKCTLVCCSLPLRMSSRRRDELPKILHFVIKE